MADALLHKIDNRSATIGIIGLGYVGLPLVRAFVGAGFEVLGFDSDPEKVSALQACRSYIQHVPSAWLEAWRDGGKFTATADMGRLGEPDALLICVPTPLGKSAEPDLSFVVSTATQIASVLRAGQLVILESTTYPGTTRDVVLPVLKASGLRPGDEFYLAYSPEREDPGNPEFRTDSIPKLVGGLDEESTALAEALYRQVIATVIRVSSCEIAEAAKIVENTYRAVNIAMVNELKVVFSRLGIDIWEVIAAAKTKPFGFQAFYPGPGLGGHCIPIDPFYLAWLARGAGVSTRFIELAGEINTGMPRYVSGRVADALNDHGKPVRGSRICVLGAAYKKDVDDPRESPAFELIRLLLDRGAIVSYSDPHIPVLPRMRRWPDIPAMESEALTADFLEALDCVLIVTDHDAFDYAMILRHAPLIVDTRNAMTRVEGAAASGKVWKS